MSRLNVSHLVKVECSMGETEREVFVFFFQAERHKSAKIVGVVGQVWVVVRGLGVKATRYYLLHVD